MTGSHCLLNWAANMRKGIQLAQQQYLEKRVCCGRLQLINNLRPLLAFGRNDPVKFKSRRRNGNSNKLDGNLAVFRPFA